MRNRCLLCAVLFACAASGCRGERQPPAASAPDPEVMASLELAAELTQQRPAASDPSGPPRIRSVRLSPDPPQPGQTLRALVDVDRGGSERVELEFSWALAGRELHDAGSAISLPKLGKGAPIRVRVVATSAAGRSEPAEASAAIRNQPPRLLDLRLEEAPAVDDEERWVARAWAQDPDGDPVEYRYAWLLNDRDSGERGAEFPTRRLKRGDRLRVRVVASDGEDDSRPVESGTIEVANASPEIVSTPPALDPSGVFRYEVKAEDPDGDRTLRYELVRGPRGMQMNAISGELSWTPEADQAGRHRVEIAVDDRQGGRATQTFLLPIVAEERWEEELPAASR